MRWTMNFGASLTALWMLVATAGCLLPAQKPWDTLDDDSADMGMTLGDDDDAVDEALELDEDEDELEAEEIDEPLD